MVGEDRVIMSVKELRRVHVIRQTMERKLTQVKAGTLLGLTPRHIRRLIERVEQEGDHGLAQLSPHKHDCGQQDSQRQYERAASDPRRPGNHGVIGAGSALNGKL